MAGEWHSARLGRRPRGDSPIRRAQTLGFALDEITALLALSDNPHASAAEVERLTQAKIADIDARIRDLQRMKQGLAALEGRCRGHGDTTQCPILAALAGVGPEPVQTGPEID